MEILYSLFLTSILVFFLNVAGSSQPPVEMSEMLKTDDWSKFFPDIPNCDRTTEPLVQRGNAIEQVAKYRLRGYENSDDQESAQCGSITLRIEPNARHIARANFMTAAPSMFARAFSIGKSDAYSQWAQCGNDPSLGSTAVYFDDDKLLEVSAFRNGASILDFAQNADYEAIRSSMNEFVKK